MTQPPPPPPPNQPPQGGFGAPQDPPPGGFGAPQDPPPGGFGAPQSPPPGGFGSPTPPPPAQGPGYGYPQAAPPASPQPSYGYPQTPPPAGQPGPGYGYPGQQQPPYGYPQQQPPYAQPPQGGGGGRKFNSSMVIIVAAVVAVALIVGGGVWYANSSGTDGGDDSKNNSSDTTGGTGGKDDTGADTSGGTGLEKAPADPAAEVLFQVPAPEVKDDQIDSVVGSWLTDSVYAKSGVNEIVGYDPDTGSEKWTLPLSGQTCAGSREVTEDGIAAVVTEGAKRNSEGDHEDCTQVTAFDVSTGKKLWTKTAAISGRKAAFEEVTISGTTVAVGGGYDGGAAFEVKSGKALWQPKVDTCADVGYAGGEQLVAVRKCGDYGSETYEVQLLDPKSGSVKWTYKLPSGIDNAKVISTKPVVFGVDSADITASGASDVFSLDDNGKLRVKITLEDGKYDHDCGVGEVYACKAIVVGNDKLYVPTRQHDGTGEYGLTNEIISFSLATGKTTGDKIDAGDGNEIFPMRMDGGNVLAYKDGSSDVGPQVISVDGKSLKQTTLLETPADDSVLSAISGMVPKSSELLYTSGRLFMGKDLISKPYSADEKEYTALGFGTD
ncbi:PQQ-binding-like beta-propeller repeat protein [Streptomyces sp. NBC_00554]|uniref:outer membrane protein assembly factor BamB family protein n=1 Tax=Streptomyces sp. NBC_00554 TaxID=2903661 RepID=UPI00352C5BF9|nr:PQQ-binding-like beta-propeller repeat protein [Streptomyces sp. NBC_00554]